jgi:hypothetical protein
MKIDGVFNIIGLSAGWGESFVERELNKVIFVAPAWVTPTKKGQSFCIKLSIVCYQSPQKPIFKGSTYIGI